MGHTAHPDAVMNRKNPSTGTNPDSPAVQPVVQSLFQLVHPGFQILLRLNKNTKIID
jgi:hypothetical protein